MINLFAIAHHNCIKQRSGVSFVFTSNNLGQDSLNILNGDIGHVAQATHIDANQGYVTTSQLTPNTEHRAIATQDIGKIKVPTLVVHHKNDACRICVPYEAARITDGLKSAPIKKFQMLDGGSDPVGDPCEALHWHGFINHEKEAVQLIGNWIKSPQN